MINTFDPPLPVPTVSACMRLPRATLAKPSQSISFKERETHNLKRCEFSSRRSWVRWRAIGTSRIRLAGFDRFRPESGPFQQIEAARNSPTSCGL